MSKDIITIKAPYVLKIGQPLWRQSPFKEVIPEVAERFGFKPAVLGQEIQSVSATLSTLPRLPYFDESKPSNEALIGYQKLRDAFASIHKANNENLIEALQSLGNTLIKYPNWLRYFYKSRIDFAQSYDSQGLWVPTSASEVKDQETGKKIKKINYRNRMEAALSYPYWAYLAQIQNGVVPLNERDPSILSEAEVTALLRRYADKLHLSDKITKISDQQRVIRQQAVGDRIFKLKPAPLEPKPISDPNEGETRYNYRMRLTDGWDDLDPAKLNLP